MNRISIVNNSDKTAVLFVNNSKIKIRPKNKKIFDVYTYDFTFTLIPNMTSKFKTKSSKFIVASTYHISGTESVVFNIGFQQIKINEDTGHSYCRCRITNITDNVRVSYSILEPMRLNVDVFHFLKAFFQNLIGVLLFNGWKYILLSVLIYFLTEQLRLSVTLLCILLFLNAFIEVLDDCFFGKLFRLKKEKDGLLQFVTTNIH